jgi:DNA-binding MarR family transcriptional regulator
MVDSRTLKLVLGAADLQEKINHYLCDSLKKKGYEITPPSLSFLSTLECGINHGSEIARNLKVSRQMVAKTVKGLCQKGYLEKIEGHGKQKQILFTQQGELLISESRQLLAELDNAFIKQSSTESIDVTLETMGSIQVLLKEF